jgi:hypothetical protein
LLKRSELILEEWEGSYLWGTTLWERSKYRYFPQLLRTRGKWMWKAVTNANWRRLMPALCGEALEDLWRAGTDS